jgi:hypothetical protein
LQFSKKWYTPAEVARDARIWVVQDQTLDRDTRGRIGLDVQAVLRFALSNDVAEELIARNVAAGIKMPKPRTRTLQPWSVEEALRSLVVMTRNEADPFYPAYVLILEPGLRPGEVR